MAALAIPGEGVGCAAREVRKQASVSSWSIRIVMVGAAPVGNGGGIAYIGVRGGAGNPLPDAARHVSRTR